MNRPAFTISAIVATLMLPACATARLPEVTGTPVVDAEGAAMHLATATLPDAPFQVNFGWNLQEGGSRANGRGVVRVEAPERIRLDLFGPRGETYLVAALTGGEYRFPASLRSPVELPSPVLLWGALGIFKVPEAAELTSATVDGPVTQLRYRGATGDLYLFAFSTDSAGAERLQRVERAVGQGIVESVNLVRDDAGLLTRTEYRDWSAYRDLTLTVESRRDGESFPPDIWRPDA